MVCLWAKNKLTTRNGFPDGDEVVLEGSKTDPRKLYLKFYYGDVSSQNIGMTLPNSY